MTDAELLEKLGQLDPDNLSFPDQMLVNSANQRNLTLPWLSEDSEIPEETEEDSEEESEEYELNITLGEVTGLLVNLEENIEILKVLGYPELGDSLEALKEATICLITDDAEKGMLLRKLLNEGQLETDF